MSTGDETVAFDAALNANSKKISCMILKASLHHSTGILINQQLHNPLIWAVPDSHDLENPTLAKAIGMSIRSATDFLDEFVRDGLVVGGTHRAKRRLFALSGLPPLRVEIALPRRPLPGRSPGRPRHDRPEVEVLEPVPTPAPALSPIIRKGIDYSDLETWMAHADAVIRQTRRNLDQMAQGVRKG